MTLTDRLTRASTTSDAGATTATVPSRTSNAISDADVSSSSWARAR